eukprot:SAG31_NODE_1553_length_7905_cov_3.137330_3_plen_342_part_00
MPSPPVVLAAALVALTLPAEMYDLVLPGKEQPHSCAHGCARWRALQVDGSPQPQLHADAMWRGPPAAGNDCAMPGRAVQCCNMYNASLAGLWPNCCPVSEMVTAPAPFGSLGAVCPGTPAWQLATATAAGADLPAPLREEYTDKAGQLPAGGGSQSPMLGDSPLCYPGTPSHTMSGPGFNGAFCWCRDPGPKEASWGLCTSPPAAVEQLNLQLAGPTAVVVSFATFHDPGSASPERPPLVEYHAVGGRRKLAQGVTHIYGMNATGQSQSASKIYYLHFVRLSNLAERTVYRFRAQSGGSGGDGGWSDWSNFTSLYTSGETRLAMYGDMVRFAFLLSIPDST